MKKHPKVIITDHYKKKLLKKARKGQEKKAVNTARQKSKKTELIYQIYTTINHNFPELFNWMREIDDCRKKSSKYELAAHLTACIAMFLFKTGSRNEYNHKREDQQFKKNYNSRIKFFAKKLYPRKLFGLPMPHGDSVHNVIALLDENQLEQLKQQMVKELFKRKVFHKSRYRGHWFRIAVDGSGVVSFDKQHCDQCLHKTSKNGKTSYFHTVLVC